MIRLTLTSGTTKLFNIQEFSEAVEIKDISGNVTEIEVTKTDGSLLSFDSAIYPNLTSFQKALGNIG